MNQNNNNQLKDGLAELFFKVVGFGVAFLAVRLLMMIF